MAAWIDFPAAKRVRHDDRVVIRLQPILPTHRPMKPLSMDEREELFALESEQKRGHVHEPRVRAYICQQRQRLDCVGYLIPSTLKWWERLFCL